MHRDLTGPRSIYRPPDQGIDAPADYPDAPVSRLLDASTPGAELFAVLVAIGGDIPLHHHPVMELQYVLAGPGLALDVDGGQIPIAPGGTVISPAGPSGAHGFRNTGSLPLTLLCVYPAPGGATPGRTPFERLT
jgi:mannose-6-phosphate isomerase-like protein (cupin superfamily)